MPSFTCPPVLLLLWIATHNSHAVGAAAYFRMKMKTSRIVVRKSEMIGWEAAMRMGLVSQHPRNNRLLFVKSYKDFYSITVKRKNAEGIEEDVVLKSRLKVKMGFNDIQEKNVPAAIHAVLIQYCLLVQGIGARDKGHPSKPAKAGSRRQERESRPSSLHNGGVALSILQDVTGKSRAHCSRMRAKITDAGYGLFKRRKIILSYAAGDERQRVLPDDHGGKSYIGPNLDGQLFKEFTSEACVNYFEFRFNRIYTSPKKKSHWKRRRKRKLKVKRVHEMEPHLPRTFYREPE